ncbi:hypothetical protein [Oceanimonas smirnovii]|uniref:hypothetical protein n=1 Tax=Oceanimonas smirnovii TaxID=264574 RepID=UPI000373020F|nr:hypothetical protein [Oceanimonas smirnovii]
MHNPAYTACKEFGYTFLAPMLTHYVRALNNKVNNHIPVCLAREGWLFKQLLNELAKNNLINTSIPPVYLKVSRTLLFRALLGHPEILPVALKSNYQGSITSLLNSRFGLQLFEIEQILSKSEMDITVNLPDDIEEVTSFFTLHSKKLKELSYPTLKSVKNYFNSLGLKSDSQPLLLDVGYSGTIQKLITLILQRDTSGFYFIATNPGITRVGNSNASMQGVLKENVALGDGYHLLDRSLFIECLLTAPHGQVVDIRENSDGSFQFFYGRRAGTQRQFQDLQAVHEGALEGVVFALKNNISYSVTEIENLYHAFLKSRNAIPQALWHLFSADDDISGNGIVNPLDLFGI